jgi:hypothetical protein
LLRDERTLGARLAISPGRLARLGDGSRCAMSRSESPRAREEEMQDISKEMELEAYWS